MIQQLRPLYIERQLRQEICGLAAEVWPIYGAWQVYRDRGLWMLRGKSPKAPDLPDLARCASSLEELRDKVEATPPGRTNV
jgi:hypothetical protein